MHATENVSILSHEIWSSIIMLYRAGYLFSSSRWFDFNRVTSSKIGYSQTSGKRPPLGPCTAVCLREVSTYKRLTNTKHHYSGLGMAAMASNQCLRLIRINFLLKNKNVIISKIILKQLLFLRSLIWKYLVDFEADKLSAWPFSGLLSIQRSLF